MFTLTLCLNTGETDSNFEEGGEATDGGEFFSIVGIGRLNDNSYFSFVSII